MSATLKNFARTVIVSDLTASALSATVEDASKLPEANGVDKYFMMVLQKTTDTSIFEIVKVTDKTGNELTIERAQEDTIKRVFSAGSFAEARVTAGALYGAFAPIEAEQDIAQNASDIFTLKGRADDIENDISDQDVINAAMSKVEAEAIREQNKDRFAQSGFRDFGKHYANNVVGGAVNEGMWTYPAAGYENLLVLGRGLDTQTGTSETPFPFTNIAGVVSELYGFARDSVVAPYQTEIKFPEAPNGTVTYDSATGIITDFTKDIDPKYGDVAGTVNEAVARAFEGGIKNGDFRLGDDGSWGTNGSLTVTYPSGIARITGTGAGTVMFINQAFAASSVPRKMTGQVRVMHSGLNLYAGQVPTGEPWIESSPVTGEWYDFEVILDASATSVNIGTSAAAFVGAVVEVRDVSLRDDTNGVVTERYDMFGLEQYLREISSSDPFAYPKGMNQSQATTMNGVATVADNVRPITYFAVFDGDASSLGKGVNWFTATNAQKKAIASDPTNNIYYDAETGKWYQWCLRQRTIAGAGNGDWLNTNANTNTDISNGILEYSIRTENRVAPQGYLDVPYSNKGATFYSPTENTSDTVYNPHPEKGAFTAYQSSSASTSGVDKHCYFYVMGTVKRLNQGAYHPSFNSAGTNFFRGSTTNTGSGRFWHDSTKIIEPNTKSDCFNSDIVTTIYGSISQGSVGRSDGRFYDGIYASGQGGVNDDRMTAWESGSPEEAAKVEAKVENGTYRGEEKLTSVDVYTDYLEYDRYNSAKLIRFSPSLRQKIGNGIITGFVFDGVRYEMAISDEGASSIGLTEGVNINGSPNWTFESSESGWYRYDFTGTSPAMFIYETDQTVSGEFEQVDVIGDPARLLLNDDLKNGWVGGWIHVIPDSATPFFEYTKKAIHGSTIAQYTDDNTAWLQANPTASWGFDSGKNSLTGFAFPPERVCVLPYTAFAAQTKESTNKPVLNGRAGFMGIRTFGFHGIEYGALLSESTIGKILVSNISGGNSVVPLAQYLIYPTGKLAHSHLDPIKHAPIGVPAPNNNSPAVKVLPYQISNNGQCSLGYQANELTYSALTAPIQLVTGVSVNITAGQTYKLPLTITNQSLAGQVCIGMVNSTVTPNDAWFTDYVIADGRFVRWNDVQDTLLRPLTSGSSDGWSDDGTIKVTNSGSDTFVDRSGIINLQVVHELAKPYGATKNRARAGTQVEGADL